MNSQVLKWKARYTFQAFIHAPNVAILLWWLETEQKNYPLVGLAEVCLELKLRCTNHEFKFKSGETDLLTFGYLLLDGIGDTTGWVRGGEGCTVGPSTDLACVEVQVMQRVLRQDWLAELEGRQLTGSHLLLHLL